MKCKLNEQQRADVLLAAGKGAANLSPRAASHLDDCPSCAGAFAAQAALWSSLDLWTVPEVSSGFNRELYARIDAASAMTWLDRWVAQCSVQIRSFFAQPAMALTIVAILAAVGFAVDHTGFTSRPGRPAQAGIVKFSPSEADQVEKTLDDIEMLRQFDLTTEEKTATSKSM